VSQGPTVRSLNNCQAQTGRHKSISVLAWSILKSDATKMSLHPSKQDTKMETNCGKRHLPCV